LILRPNVELTGVISDGTLLWAWLLLNTAWFHHYISSL